MRSISGGGGSHQHTPTREFPRIKSGACGLAARQYARVPPLKEEADSEYMSVKDNLATVMAGLTYSASMKNCQISPDFLPHRSVQAPADW
jgi:hypothetical protein